MSSFEFRLIKPTFHSIEQIVKLRKKAYAEKYQQHVNLWGLEWNKEDQGGYHFGAFLNEQLISCIRLTEIKSPQQFESTLEFPSDHEFSYTPSFSLARAATESEFYSQSLNMELRKQAYRFIQRNFPNQQTYIYGTALAGSKRLLFLKELGYEIVIHQKPWARFLNSSGADIAIFRLSTQLLDQVLEKMQQTVSRAHASHDHKSFKPF